MFSSNDMEHGVLRGNAASPAHPWSLLGRPQWAPPAFAKAADPRAALVRTLSLLLRYVIQLCITVVRTLSVGTPC